MAQTIADDCASDCAPPQPDQKPASTADAHDKATPILSAVHRALAIYEISDAILTFASWFWPEWDGLNLKSSSWRTCRAVCTAWRNIIEEKALANVTITNGEFISRLTETNVQGAVLEDPTRARMVKRAWLSSKWWPCTHRMMRIKALVGLTALHEASWEFLDGLEMGIAGEAIILPRVSYLHLYLEALHYDYVDPISPSVENLPALAEMRLVVQASLFPENPKGIRLDRLWHTCATGLRCLDIDFSWAWVTESLEELAPLRSMEVLDTMTIRPPARKHTKGFMAILPDSLRQLTVNCCALQMQEVLANLRNPMFLPGLRQPPILYRFCPDRGDGRMYESGCPGCSGIPGPDVRVPGHLIEAVFAGWLERETSTPFDEVTKTNYMKLTRRSPNWNSSRPGETWFGDGEGESGEATQQAWADWNGGNDGGAWNWNESGDAAGGDAWADQPFGS